MRKPNYFRLGLFVLLAVAALVAMLFVFGGRSLFEPKATVETYFNESVSGLEVGAPVKLRGVQVGEVSEIALSPALYQTDLPLDDVKTYVVVRMRLRGFTDEELRRNRDAYLRRGLRATTQLAGVTGQLFISLDVVPPEQRSDLPISWKPAHPYLPSAPSLTNIVLNNVQKFLATLDKAEVDQLSQSMSRLASTLETQVREAQVGKLSAELSATLAELRGLTATVQRTVAAGRIDDTLRSLNATASRLETIASEPAFQSVPRDLAVIAERLRRYADSGELERLVERLDATVRRADQMLGNNEYDLRASVDDLRTMLANLRELTENANRDAPGLLFAPPPRPVVLPGASR